MANLVHSLNRAGARLRQVHVTLEGGGLRTEAGALHFLKGEIEMESSAGGPSGLAKKMASAVLSGESVFKPTYRGHGEVFLEPSFGHFILLRVENEEMIADKGIYYCSDVGLEVGAVRNSDLAARLAGGEGWFQTRIAGRGLCVLHSPVPPAELKHYRLNNETLRVDGNFAVLRKGLIDFTVEKSSRSLFGSISSGEGLLQTFRGTGEVWLAPTQSVYAWLQARAEQQLAQALALLKSGANR
ncbi:MAG TPA: AIM24 family protein [Longimicrobiaceae bacterium]|nr:AIM24 family protein [Longimicrobiaceae bacterium]